MMGDEAPARNWYEDFLVLLGDAESDVPIYNKPNPNTPSSRRTRGFFPATNH